MLLFSHSIYLNLKKEKTISIFPEMTGYKEGIITLIHGFWAQVIYTIRFQRKIGNLLQWLNMLLCSKIMNKLNPK